MLRHLTQRPTWIALGCAIIAVFVVDSSVFGQDSQRAATAKVARDKIAAENTAKASPSNAAATSNNAADTSAADSESLKRKAGERVGSAPRGKSLILGMHVQEFGRGGVKIVEVAAASPAFEAGIREGDELVTFAGFQATDYRKWIEGMSRLTTAAEDNSMLPVVVIRRGDHVDAQIRVPEGHSAALKLPLGPLPQQAPPIGPDAVFVPGAPVAGDGGDNIAINNVGPFANFFNDSAPVSERAMAEIFRVGGETPPAFNSGRSAPGAAPPANTTRIGLAGFRNDPNGMLVMVDVGGLPPGNYLVGIADPSVVGLQVNQSAGPGVQPKPSSLPPTASPQVPPAAGNSDGRNIPNAPPAKGPINPGVTLPQSNLPPDAQREIPKSILAQVSDNTQQATGTTIPPTGQVQPLTAPPTGQVNPTNTTPTGQSTVNNALVDQANRANAARSGTGSSGGPMLHQVGTLTVDQSGTGRMQHVVEGVRVRDVVGQAIVLYAQAGNEQTLPANLDPTVDPTTAKTASDAAQPASNTTPANGIPAASAKKAPTPVAAGIIRLMSDRRPPPANPPTDDEVFGPAVPPVQQPANKTPPIGTNPIR